MKTDEMLRKLQRLQLERSAYNHAISCLEFDSETIAPSASSQGRSVTLGILSQRAYELFVNEETENLLSGLAQKKDELAEPVSRQVELLSDELTKMTRIPMEEYVDYQKLINEASEKWREAKSENDYALFEPYLDRIIKAQRRFAVYYDPNKKPYDALLNEYEKGLTTETLDNFFSMLRVELAPLINALAPAPEPAFLSAYQEKAKQRELSAWVMDLMGLDKTRTAISEVMHPFTQAFNNHDVRITTHYDEHAVLSSLFSVIHEGGHALYELQMADELQYTTLVNVSMSMHESQSRLYENMVGHHPAFIRFLTPKLRALFSEAFAGVSDDAVLRAVNRITPSLIRTEADEVTYPLHIMVRYEMEKQLISGALSAHDAPEQWNELYRKYLGVVPRTDAEGILQDVHWSGGMIGYFPSYALGSAYAAQFMHQMGRELDIEKLLSAGNIAPITAWLAERIHRFGALYEPDEMLLKVTGEPFNPIYYIRHLHERVKEFGV